MLHDRLRCLLDDGGWPDAASFDPDDDRQLDAVARRLLGRFLRRRDAEAFALLLLLTRGRLLDIATRLSARLEADVPPAALVEALSARLFNADDTPAAAAEDMGFFAEARRAMTALARSWSSRSDGRPGPRRAPQTP